MTTSHGTTAQGTTAEGTAAEGTAAATPTAGTTEQAGAPVDDRSVTVERETRETRIRVTLGAGDGSVATVDTGVPFLDHMLVTFARYSGLALAVHARGDLRHHTIEDVAIVVGTALARALPATAARYGDRTIPMDDALVHAAIDLGGRPYYEGPLPSTMYDHWMRSFADNARATLHLRVLRGRDRHHVVEAAFKALGLAVRDAFVETGAVFSTKGSVREDAH